MASPPLERTSSPIPIPGSVVNGHLFIPESHNLFPPNSPVSPRVKNIKEDMEALILSRQDNPYLLSKLENCSNAGDVGTSSNLTISISSNCRSPPDPSLDLVMNNNALDYSFISMDLDDLPEPNITQSDLHDHLIRSPPPQFPQKISHFVYPTGSPIKALNQVSSSSPSINRADPSDRRLIDEPLIPGLMHHRKSITIGETADQIASMKPRRGSDTLVMAHSLANTGSDMQCPSGHSDKSVLSNWEAALLLEPIDAIDIKTSCEADSQRWNRSCNTKLTENDMSLISSDDNYFHGPVTSYVGDINGSREALLSNCSSCLDLNT